MVQEASVLLYDGSCGLCHRGIRFILNRERRRTLLFASLDSTFARNHLTAFSSLSLIDSMIWIEFDAEERPVRAHVRSAAGLHVARYLGGAWTLLTVFWLVPRPVRDWLYDLVARHRHRLPGTDATLTLPDSVHHRFIVNEQ